MYSPLDTYTTTILSPKLCATLLTRIADLGHEQMHHHTRSELLAKDAFSLNTNNAIKSVSVHSICTLRLLDKLRQDIRHFNIFTDYSLTVTFDHNRISAQTVKARVQDVLYRGISDKYVLSIGYESENELCFIVEYEITEELVTKSHKLATHWPYDAMNAMMFAPITWYGASNLFTGGSVVEQDQVIAAFRRYVYFLEYPLVKALSVDLYRERNLEATKRNALHSLISDQGQALQEAWFYKIGRAQVVSDDSIVGNFKSRISTLIQSIKLGIINRISDPESDPAFVAYVHSRITDLIDTARSTSSLDEIKSWATEIKQATSLREKTKKLICAGNSIRIDEDSVHRFRACFNESPENLTKRQIVFFNKDAILTSQASPDEMIVITDFLFGYDVPIHLPDIYIWCVDALAGLPFYATHGQTVTESGQKMVTLSIRVLLSNLSLSREDRYDDALETKANFIQTVAEPYKDLFSARCEEIDSMRNFDFVENTFRCKLSSNRRAAHLELTALWVHLYNQKF